MDSKRSFLQPTRSILLCTFSAARIIGLLIINLYESEGTKPELLAVDENHRAYKKRDSKQRSPSTTGLLQDIPCGLSLNHHQLLSHLFMVL